MSRLDAPCRTCGKHVVADTGPDDSAPLPPHYPFCSRRCRLIDLGRWAEEEFRVPADPDRRSDVPSEE